MGAVVDVEDDAEILRADRDAHIPFPSKDGSKPIGNSSPIADQKLEGKNPSGQRHPNHDKPGSHRDWSFRETASCDSQEVKERIVFHDPEPMDDIGGRPHDGGDEEKNLDKADHDLGNIPKSGSQNSQHKPHPIAVQANENHHQGKEKKVGARREAEDQ